jgi:hypothetical protein
MAQELIQEGNSAKGFHYMVDKIEEYLRTLQDIICDQKHS